MTSVGEFRDLGVEDLRQRVRDIDDQLFRMRLQKSMGQLESPAKIRTLRKDLARAKTVLREREPASARAAARPERT